MTNRVILRGITGSQAYGLAREGSDVDRQGVFISPALEIAGLDWHPKKESIVTKAPDCTMHEVGKYLRLALNANPTVLEVLWLSAENYDVTTGVGYRLRDLRYDLLSEHAVRASYGGYALSYLTLQSLH